MVERTGLLRGLGVLGLCLCVQTPVAAQGLPDLLVGIFGQSDKVQAARANLDAATERVRVTRGAWFPTVEFSGSGGYERQLKPDADDSRLYPREAGGKITQLITDFGATTSRVNTSTMRRDQARVALTQAEQDLIGEAATAYANLVRGFETYDYALQSEENIRRQTGVEEVRIRTGAGVSTDLLQAKTQLAGAQARRVAAASALDVGRHRFNNVFGMPAPSEAGLQFYEVREAAMPKSLAEAEETAQRNNPQLLQSAYNISVANEAINENHAKSWYPKVEAVAEQKFKEDVDGTSGFKRETVGKVQLSLPLNLGLTAINQTRALQADLLSAQRTKADLQRTILELVRNGWRQLEAARERARLLAEQADIAQAFLDMAKQERRLGTRSLIDVLSGETSLINALSDAASAETDIVLAAIEVLRATGDLNLDVFALRAASNPAR